MKKFLLDIITPDRSAFSEKVDYLSVPTREGRIGILAHHAAIFSEIVEGEVKIRKDDSEYFLVIGGGFLDVGGNRAALLVSRAYHADELNEAQIRKAQDSAGELLSTAKEKGERERAVSMLRRSVLELKVWSHRFSRHPPLSSQANIDNPRGLG